MIEFFSGIATFLESIVRFVRSLIDGVIRLLKYLVVAVNGTIELMTWLPADLAILAGGFLAVAIVYLIVGRDTK